MILWLIIGAASLLFLMGVWVWERLPRWRKEAARKEREPLTAEQFGERFFRPDLSLIATRLRHIASDQLGEDLLQLRPDDRVAEVLSAAFDSMDTVEFLMAIEEEFGIELDEAAWTNIDTFDDLVNAVAARRPFLAKWRRSMGRAIEEQFGVTLSREALAKVTTPLAVMDAVAAEFKEPVQAQGRCQSQRAFYLLRNAMTRTLHKPRSLILPRASLRKLIPWRTARSIWPQLRDAVGARRWPALVRPRWASWLVYGVPLLFGAAAVIGLPWLADRALRWSNTLGFVISFASELRALFAVALVLFSWICLVRVSQRFSWSFPRGIRAVGDLVPFVVTSAEMTWTREQILQKVRDLVVAQLQVPPERYQAGGRFVEEFGMEIETGKP